MSRLADERQTLRTIFAAPTVIGLASASGLASGLLGAGGWDVIACLGLGAAIAVPVAFALRRPRP